MKVALAACAALMALAAHAGQPVLTLDYAVPLGNVAGRIDHLALDTRRQRLLVAELGNDALGIVDLGARRLLQTVGGFAAPQGVGYEASADVIAVANGGDGTVRLLRAADYSTIASVALDSDADDVRVAPGEHVFYVGYGAGGLAIIDPMTRRLRSDLPLSGHPEGFVVDEAAASAWVNVPDRGRIDVVDRRSGAMSSAWRLGGASANFPMALDARRNQLAVGFRRPPSIAGYDARSGQRVYQVESCGDADDLFLDERRHRLYVICGAGYVDVFAQEAAGYRSLARIPTRPGARTGWFSPELDRLFVALRADRHEGASVWAFKPAP